ncbi:TonB-dependent receptor [Pelagicoccus sp. SDUM812002]|uniref:TonB-dependent receptor n=1 Tax=Pelagicoccus sp. SDUM812002 TaxID=3041266 RepID=UPI00280EAD6A|nr:TonB-dependent receptor [Pelagicoccus sp. SDUM812002]MDQ8188270.1 TonB-dependent receptor [Pelagicoccus sp. SDUM812002]
MRANSIFIAAILFATFASGQSEPETFELDPLVANANRISAAGNYAQAAVSTIGLPDLELGQFRDISDALAFYPGIASYRRTHSIAAHPTTQGVRLRNFGANATSRSLVLYNGVPQNDPFGAWIYWNQYDLSQVEALMIHPSGIGETWGNMASGGLVSMIAREAAPGARSFEASLGSSDRYDIKAYAAEKVGDEAVFDLGIHHSDTDGFHTLLESQRGAVDEPANSTATSLNSRLSWTSGDYWNSQISLRLLDEERGNGTPVGRNSTESLDLSLISEREIPSQAATLNLSLYLQDRDFQNVFASVDDDRSSESPALDQYDVPAQAIGGAITYRSDSEQRTSYAAGVDFRLIEGSVNERYRNLGAGFTRERYAGGEQEFFGIFTQVDSQFLADDKLSFTARLEEVSRRSGQRTETNTETNSIILDDQYPDNSDTVLSGNLNWVHTFSETVSTQVALFSGYRAPTLNELYRPFRVRNDITEANPELANERHQGLEVSVQRDSTDGMSKLRLSAFSYEAEEMVANALFTTESGFDPRFGFIPEGGSGSARVNLDRSRVSGFELQASQQLTDTVHASLTAVYADTEIRGDELGELVGNSFPQSSPWKAVASLDWSATERLALWTNYRWYDRSWENLSNTRRLGATADLSAGARLRLDENSSLSLAVTNLFDEENVTGIATNGLVTIDEPREILLTYSWRK